MIQPAGSGRWPRETRRADLAALPVVVFGDEGGIHVTARSLRDLFRRLACDRPLWVDWAGTGFGEYEGYHRDGDGRGRARETYLAWLDQHFGLTPAAGRRPAIG
ncbi:hypothetical protein AB0J63_25040 [Streptosporangium canum]|uniref:hypothetical protein n=1 Tax=Streptosporangium canum TaxID=324952 RepID=UPI003434B68F